MIVEEELVVLPVRRWRTAVASAWFTGVVGLGVLAWRWLRTLPETAAQGLATLVIFALTGLVVVGVGVVRSFADAALTATAEHLRFHAGDVPLVRWGRIAAVDPAGVGRPLRLALHGRTHPVEVPGTRWLSRAERVDLVAWLEEHRRVARREERRRALR